MFDQHVRDWMTREVFTIGPDAKIPAAHQLMREKRVRRLPVVENGVLVGIVTLSDVLRVEPSTNEKLSVYELNYLIAGTRIGRVMRQPVVSVAPGATIRDAAQLMLEHKLGGLPVVDAGRVVGIITESDIFRLLVRVMNG